jgi:signal-transduction protein with cAMP-binding, CBS, and nucleotidyltransferase domain
MDTLRTILENKGRVLHRISPEETALAAVDEMCRLQVGVLLVTEGDMTLGILSERDIMRRVTLLRRDPAETLVRDVMTSDVACISEDASIDAAMALMTDRRVRHLPVMREGRVAGMISMGDLVHWVSQNQEFEIRMLNDYVSGRYPG